MAPLARTTSQPNHGERRLPTQKHSKGAHPHNSSQKKMRGWSHPTLPIARTVASSLPKFGKSLSKMISSYILSKSPVSATTVVIALSWSSTLVMLAVFSSPSLPQRLILSAMAIAKLLCGKGRSDEKCMHALFVCTEKNRVKIAENPRLPVHFTEGMGKCANGEMPILGR